MSDESHPLQQLLQGMFPGARLVAAAGDDGATEPRRATPAAKPRPITDLVILQRALLIAQTTGDPQPCRNGPWCPGCICALACSQLHQERGQGRLDEAYVAQAKSVVRLCRPLEPCTWTQELAVSVFTQAVEGVS